VAIGLKNETLSMELAVLDSKNKYRIAPGKHPWALGAQTPKFWGGPLHGEVAE